MVVGQVAEGQEEDDYVPVRKILWKMVSYIMCHLSSGGYQRINIELKGITRVIFSAVTRSKFSIC